jgi:hypothetical protein
MALCSCLYTWVPYLKDKQARTGSSPRYEYYGVGIRFSSRFGDGRDISTEDLSTYVYGR